MDRRSFLAGGLTAVAAPALTQAASATQWTLAHRDDFNGNALGSDWYLYSGQPGGDAAAIWDPSHCKVSGGILTLVTNRDPAHPGVWTSGGCQLNFPLTYGKYEVRMKADPAPQVACICLLWPVSNRWPVDGEIDLFEDAGGNRTVYTATVHYGANNAMIQRSIAGNFTQWHTVGVEWTPGRLAYTVDGSTMATVSSSGIPGDAMNLCLQAQTWNDAPGIPPLVNLYFDWVALYRYTP